MSKLSKEDYENAIRARSVLERSIADSNEELIKVLDRLCALRRRVVQDQSAIRHLEKTIIDVYEFHKQLERETGEMNVES